MKNKEDYKQDNVAEKQRAQMGIKIMRGTL